MEIVKHSKKDRRRSIHLIQNTMFVVPAAISVVLDAVCFWVAVRAIGPTFVIVAFMGLRLIFLAMFAAVYYCER